jgi:hypothetical protein
VKSCLRHSNYDTLSQKVSNMTFQSTGLLGGNSTFQGNLADSLGDLLFNWKNSEVAFYLSIPGSDIPTEKFHSSMQSGARIQSYSRVVTAT